MDAAGQCVEANRKLKSDRGGTGQGSGFCVTPGGVCLGVGLLGKCLEKLWSCQDLFDLLSEKVTSTNK